MFERFTQEARQVVVYAQEEARLLNHHYIGTEHLLLGLLRAEERVGGGERPLESLGVHLDEVRAKVISIVGPAEEPPPSQLPFTPRAKKVLELALREALGLGHQWIQPAHILLGLTRENEGVAARILPDLGADSEKIQRHLAELLAAKPQTRPPPPVIAPHPAPPPIDLRLLDGLQDVLGPLGHDICHELGRDPDSGDLLLAMACAHGTLAADAFRDLGVDPDALWGTLERIRQQRVQAREQLRLKIEEVRAKKEGAIQDQNFQEAAQLRDEERELAEQMRLRTPVGREALEEIRRRLGLPNR